MCRALIAGGGAPEIELAIRLLEHSHTLSGMEQYCFRAFADAMDVIPFTLAENAGLNPIATVTELRNHHAQGHHTFGINVRKVCSDFYGIFIWIGFFVNLLPCGLSKNKFNIECQVLARVICFCSVSRELAAAQPGLWNSLSSHLKEADLTYSRYRLSLKIFLFGYGAV